MSDDHRLRLDLACPCGNRDDMDIAAPPCSAECGRHMRLAKPDLLPPMKVTDPAFHQGSYDQGFRDGESDVVADYQFALTELQGFDWPENRGFYPNDVAVVLTGLARPLAEALARLTNDALAAVWLDGTRYEEGEDKVDYAKADPAGLRAALLTALANA